MPIFMFLIIIYVYYADIAPDHGESLRGRIFAN